MQFAYWLLLVRRPKILKAPLRTTLSTEPALALVLLTRLAFVVYAKVTPMSQSVEDVRRLAGILGTSLYATSLCEEFGQVIVRLEAREVSDSQLEALQRISSEVNSRNGGSEASISFDALSKRVYYSLPEQRLGAEYNSFKNSLKHAGVALINGR